MKLLVANLAFTVLVPGMVAGFVPWRLVGEVSIAGWPGACGLALLAVGSAIYLWCLWDFAVFGRGTPAPVAAPKRLVVRGLYRWSRNPMYLGVLTAILGWAALARSPGLLAYAGGVFVCFQLFIVLYEEPHLGRAFGQDYVAYRTRVARWLGRASRRR